MAGGVIDAVLARASSHAAWLATPHPPSSSGPLLGGPLETLVVPWACQLVFSWVGFGIFASWDYAAYTAADPARGLAAVKLPSRHPVHEAEDGAAGGWVARALAAATGRAPSPFVYNHAMMVPLVLYNQLVVWPLVSLALVWPAWAPAHAPPAAWSSPAALAAAFVACMLASDALWYASHRLMHTPYAWRALHKMHHVAPQVALSATYVHPWEYALFTASMQLPFALAGFPVWLHAVPLSWGMLTGSGAHSGYSGPFANGDKHNAHHYFHNVNFGLLMVADALFGTHWAPGDPPPPAWEEAAAIARAYKAVVGTDNAKAFALGATVG